MPADYPKQRPWWKTPYGIGLSVFLCAAAFFLVTEPWAHVIPYLPFVLFLLCPLLHFSGTAAMETVVIRVRMPLTGNMAKGLRVAMQGTLLDYSHLSPLKEVNLADTFPEVRLDVPRCGASPVHDPWI